MYISVSGVSGNVSINGNGDREADYALLDMDPKTGRFDVRSIREHSHMTSDVLGVFLTYLPTLIR